ncbi:MAG: virulence protein, partial [Syntrophomonadaceae bacterium]|nr:virulence protein [Syntrophomonadaceae bacterium]
MRINYNVTGAKRKKLVEAISRELETEAKYLAAPSFAYQVGDYTVDRNGVLEGEDNPELVADLLRLYDLKRIKEEYDAPILETELVVAVLENPSGAE